MHGSHDHAVTNQITRPNKATPNDTVSYVAPHNREAQLQSNIQFRLRGVANPSFATPSDQSTKLQSVKKANISAISFANQTSCYNETNFVTFPATYFIAFPTALSCIR